MGFSQAGCVQPRKPMLPRGRYLRSVIWSATHAPRAIPRCAHHLVRPAPAVIFAFEATTARKKIGAIGQFILGAPGSACSDRRPCVLSDNRCFSFVVSCGPGDDICLQNNFRPTKCCPQLCPLWKPPLVFPAPKRCPVNGNAGFRFKVLVCDETH